jgi:hypothetical protein
MLKKVLTIISILLVAINVCAYAEKTDPDYERLFRLGIIDESYERYEKKKTISEKEFLSALVRLITDEKIEEDKIPDYAKSRGIISRINNTELNSAVSYGRAVNLSLNLLGYSKIIEMQGNNSEAVISLAGSSGLSKGMALMSGDNLNGKSFIQLLTNLIDANIINTSMGKSGSADYKLSNKDILSEYRDITKISGKVTSVCDTSLLRENGCGQNRISVDEVTYKIGYDYSAEMLGQTVYAYVKKVDNVLTAYYVEPQFSDTKRIEIKDKDIKDVIPKSGVPSKITYETEERTFDIELNPALTVIYNGQNYTGYTWSDLKPTCGSIVCLDFDNDNKYDIVHVYSYETVVVQSVSDMYRTIKNLYNIPTTVNPCAIDILDLGNKSLDNIRIYSEGEKVSFSSILANNILSIAISKSTDPIYTIYVSKETVNGEFGTINPNKKIVTIGEDEYRVNDTYYDALTAGNPIDVMSFGSVYTCYLDVFGNVAFIKHDLRDGYEYAYFLKQTWYRIENTAKMRLLTSDGEWEDVYYAKKVKLNNDNRADAIDVYNELEKNTDWKKSTGEYKPQLIMIKRDADGRLKAIKMVTVSSKYNPNKFTTPQTSEFGSNFWSQDSSFNCRHYLKYDAAIFIRPKNSSDTYNEDKYTVVSAGYFKGDKTYNYLAYNLDKFGFPDAFVVSANTPGTSSTIYVNNVLTVLNSDDESVRAVVGNLEGLKDMTVQISPEFTDAISVGDVIEVSLKDAKIVAWNDDPQESSNLTATDSVTGIPLAEQYHLADALSTSRAKDAPAISYNIHKNYQVFRGDIEAIDTERRMILLDCGADGMRSVYIKGDASINFYNQNTQKYELISLNDVPSTGYVIIRMNGNNVTSVGVYR